MNDNPAVNEEDLELDEDNRAFFRGVPFTGELYSLYPDGELVKSTRVEPGSDLYKLVERIRRRKSQSIRASES